MIREYERNCREETTRYLSLRKQMIRTEIDMSLVTEYAHQREIARSKGDFETATKFEDKIQAISLVYLSAI